MRRWTQRPLRTPRQFSIPVSASSYVSDPTLPPEEQIQARVDFTNKLVEDVEAKAVAQDNCASGEKGHILEAWGGLKAMSEDILSRIQSRPSSAIGFGRNSRVSLNSAHTGSFTSKKSASYAHLSLGRDSGRSLWLVEGEHQRHQNLVAVQAAGTRSLRFVREDG